MATAAKAHEQERSELHPFAGYLTGGIPVRRAIGVLDCHSAPGGSTIEVRLEAPFRSGLPWTVSNEPTIEFDLILEGGPDGDRQPDTVTLWPNDVPALIACLIHAAHNGIVDGALPQMEKEGAALIAALYRVLPRFDDDAQQEG